VTDPQPTADSLVRPVAWRDSDPRPGGALSGDDMGCDIHAFLEVRSRKSGDWLYYGEVDIGRYYELFERMAGVRGSVSNAMVQPRGLPVDLSPMTGLLREHWGGDGHSDSWLTAEEMAQLDKWYQVRGKASKSLFVRDHAENLYLFGNDITSWWLYPSERPREIIDIRLVFWFDN